MRAEDAQMLSDGRNVRWTLERIYREQPGRCRIDWLRFTVPLDAIVSRDSMLPPNLDALAVMERTERDLIRATRTVDAGEYTGAMAVAKSAVSLVSGILGVFDVGPVEDKGVDFYSARCSFQHNGATVGFALAGAKTQQQASTVHVNLTGTASLHVSHEKWCALAHWLGEVGGTITRVDIALDIFDGLCMLAVQQAWKDGAFDVRGKRPKQREVGSWSSGHSRTFEAGRRETGKVCRIYEKGDEQFGEEANDPWVRVECEFRSNHRVIDLAVLTNPADFFAGASKFCADLAAQHECEAEPTSIKTLAAEAVTLVALTAKAKVLRSVNWIARTAMPSVARALEYGGDVLEAIYDRECWRTPKRLVGLSHEEMRHAFKQVAEGLAPSPAPFVNGAA